MASFSSLMDDCLYHVMEFIQISDLVRLRKVNKKLREKCDYFMKHCLTQLNFNSFHYKVDYLWPLQNCKNVKYVLLTEIDDDIVDELCELPQLKVVNLQYCWFSNDNDVLAIASECPNLEALLGANSSVSARTIRFVPKTLAGRLKWLDFNSCHGDDKKVLPTIAKYCPNLRKIDVSSLPMLSNEEIHRLVTKCSKINDLTISVPTEDSLSDACLSYVADNLSMLKKLDLGRSIQFTDKGLCSIATKCKDIRKLDLSFLNKITDNSLKAIGENLKFLSDLSLRRCESVTDEGIIHVTANCKHLRILDLTNIQKLTDRAVMSTADNCRKLTLIKLGPTENITDELICYLMANCPSLQGLALNSLLITKKSLKNIHVNSKWLSSLQVVNCPEISHKHLDRVTRPDLSVLFLTCSQFEELQKIHKKDD